MKQPWFFQEGFKEYCSDYILAIGLVDYDEAQVMVDQLSVEFHAIVSQKIQYGKSKLIFCLFA
jgi:hypothetical protein